MKIRRSLLLIGWLYFSTAGRLSVRGAMSALLALLAVAIVIATGVVRFAALTGSDEIAVGWVALKVGAACALVPVLGVLIKRAHDLDWPG